MCYRRKTAYLVTSDGASIEAKTAIFAKPYLVFYAVEGCIGDQLAEKYEGRILFGDKKTVCADNSEASEGGGVYLVNGGVIGKTHKFVFGKFTVKSFCQLFEKKIKKQMIVATLGIFGNVSGAVIFYKIWYRHNYRRAHRWVYTCLVKQIFFCYFAIRQLYRREKVYALAL